MNGRYNSKKFYSYTFFFTFLFWFIGAYYSFDKNNQLYIIPLLIGLMMPFLIAVFLIYTEKTSTLKLEFKSKFLIKKDINKKVLPIFILIMPISIIISIFISLFFDGSLEQFTISKEFSFSSGVLPVLLLLLFAATFEELGWRGYGFESLENKYSFLTTSILFSVLWSFWHLPLIFVNNSYQYNILNENILYGLNFYISIIPMGIIISWLWIKNNKNILLAIIFHFIINISQEALEITQTTKLIQTFVLSFFVLVLFFYDKELFLSKGFKNNEK